jgi:Spy/CpxP family protein refolding chaperone
MTEPTVQQKATFWLALVFVLGTALGAVLGYAFAHRSYASTAPTQLTSEQRRAQKREQLARDVNLTAEQQGQVNAILDQAQIEYKAIHAVSDPQVDAVRQKTREKIRHILAPDQKPKFEEFIRRMDEERKRLGQ